MAQAERSGEWYGEVGRAEVAKRLAQVRELVAAAEANLEEKERVHGLCKPRERMMAIVQAQSRLLFAYEAYYRLREMYG